MGNERAKDRPKPGPAKARAGGKPVKPSSPAGPKPGTAPAKNSAPGLPSKRDVLEFLQTTTERVGKRELARAFQIRGEDRVGFKELLREMADEGLLTGNRKQFKKRGGLPPVTVIAITGRDADGEFYGAPEQWDEAAEGPPPRILIGGVSSSFGAAPGIGERVLAKLTAISAEGDGYDYIARPMKRLGRDAQRQLGIFRAASKGGGGAVLPVEKRQLKEFPVAPSDAGGASDGDLVRFDLVRGGRLSIARARIIQVLGNPSDQRQASLIAVHAHGIREDFPAEVLNEVGRLHTFAIDKRADLRELPLVTIDPVDARDHDDAVHASPDTDPANTGGHVVHVAIADVAHYVRPGSSLDREALVRGNSTYFPDRVVPMLPERLSNDLCSLKEGVDRPCLVVRMVFDKNGHKREHRFIRAVMRSAAKLHYAQAQAAIDGAPDAATGPLLESVLKPLWAAFRTVARARDQRGPLDLDLPERKILLDGAGRVSQVVIPERLEAHRLIEEFMIQANVAAAETLEDRATPLVYRVHEAPSPEKLSDLSNFLETLEIRLPKAGAVRAANFNQILALVKGGEVSDLVNEVILRSQAQADYRPQNLGHFGLNLGRYAHFTSPIRRYADLIVHRALIKALALGPDGLTDQQAADLHGQAQLISQAERRSMAAERETQERLIAAYLAERVGEIFKGKISGVTKSGLFVKLSDTGADGFIPAALLGQDYYRYEPDHHALVGDQTGAAFQLGDAVEVRLQEAIPTAGALRFEIVSAPSRKLTRLRGRRRPSHPMRGGPRHPKPRRKG